MYALACPATRKTKSDCEEDGLIGPVRVVKLLSVVNSSFGWFFGRQRKVLAGKLCYDRTGNKIEAVIYQNAGQKESRFENYDFDAAGRRTEWRVVQGNSRIKTSYHYDKENRIEAFEKTLIGEHVIKRKYDLVFNDRGDQVEASYEDDRHLALKARYRYDYTDEGQIAAIETYGSDGHLYHKMICEHDSDGRVITKSCLDWAGTMYEKIAVTYGISTRTEEKVTFKNGDLVSKIVYRYDAQENLIDVACFDSHYSLQGKTSHSFNLDGMGNWIEKISESCGPSSAYPITRWTEHRRLTYW